MKGLCRWAISAIALTWLAACVPSAPTAPPTATRVDQTSTAGGTREPRLAETRAAETRAVEYTPTNTRAASSSPTRTTQPVLPTLTPRLANPTMTSAARVTATVPDLRGVFGSPVTFATHADLEKYGFSAGPSDGQFGAIPTGGAKYLFFGFAASNSSCAGTPAKVAGTYSFAGTLDQVTGSNGCILVFGKGDGPRGWIFDKDYAGGGQVIHFSLGGRSGWLMPFHAEIHWQNPATADHRCEANGGATVPCFYSSLGLAVSTDEGKTFKVVGEILQPSQPMSAFTGTNQNMMVGYGSLVVADANGKHLDNPPAHPEDAYFYLFYTDQWPAAPGVCAAQLCLGVARAGYAEVIEAALSGDPHQVAKVFHKYDAANPNPWTQPATSDTPDMSGTAGIFAPLVIDEAGGVQVIYDKNLDVYLAIYHTGKGIDVRASSDLIHWSEPIGAPYSETGRTLYYPTFIGEMGDPTIAGLAPRIYFSSFPTGAYPDYSTSVFESVQLTLSKGH